MKPKRMEKRKFGDVEVRWKCDVADVPRDIELYWNSNLIVAKALGREGREPEQRLRFSAFQDSLTDAGVSGAIVLTFDSAGLRHLALELQHGCHPMRHHRLWPDCDEPRCEPEHEPARPERIATDETIALDTDGCPETDLFPYLYLRKWGGGVDPQQMQDRFLSYFPDSNGADPGFYAKLLQAANAQRAALARTYIEREAPFDGADHWIGGLEELPAPFPCFSRCQEALLARAEHCGGELPHWCFWDELAKHTGMQYSELRPMAMTPAFAATIDRCWLAVFALLLAAADRSALLDGLIRTIIVGHLLRRMCVLMAVPDDPEHASQPLPEHEHAYWTRRRVGEAIVATPVLPAAVFVLPDHATARSGEPALPFVIGELQLVRQRLARYALGEVSRIDNVMKGEAIETTRRQLERTSHSASSSGSLASASDTSLGTTQADYFDEAYKTLAEAFKFTRGTTYGPPTSSAALASAAGAAPVPPAGSLETVKLEPLDHYPRAKTLERAARIARDVTARTASQLARRAEWARASSSLTENEETVVNRIDGSRNERHVRGIHRWVDKIFRAHVVNYGHRLLLELYIDEPARDYVSRERSVHGESLCRPKSLEEVGVHVYTDISVDPGPTNYANLIRYYGSTDATLPPQQSMIVNASLQAGQAVSCQEIAIPDGYQVISATVSASWNPAGGITAIAGLLGIHGFEFGNKGGAVLAPAPQTFSLSSDAATLPFAIACTQAPAPPPSLPAYRAPLVGMVSVSLALAPTPAAQQRWQFQFYQAMEAAYARRLKAYFQASGGDDAAGVGRPGHNPLANQQAVRHTLRRRIGAKLRDQAGERCSGSGGAAASCESLLEHAFEWQEMAYSFDAGEAGAAELADTDDLLPAFLQAGSARVLLPVRPDHAFPVVYWLSCSLLWHGAPSLTPVYERSPMARDAVNELKSCSHGGHEPHACSRPWEIRVPTAMTVLQHGDELPVFDREGTCARMER